MPDPVAYRDVGATICIKATRNADLGILNLDFPAGLGFGNAPYGHDQFLTACGLSTRRPGHRFFRQTTH